MVDLWGWTEPFTNAAGAIGDAVTGAAKDVVRHVDENIVKPLDAVVRDVGNAVGDFKDKAAGLVGLGKKANAISGGTASYDAAPRTVYFGWHPVGGVGGVLFENMITPLQGVAAISQIKGMPNPTHHWAVLIGDYIHELNADTKLDVVYQNYKFDASELWYKKEVGTTRFNDEALRMSGEKAIDKMAGSYNLINNNCQKFALGMLDVILQDPRPKFTTSYAFDACVALPDIERKMRPVVNVFATEETKEEVVAAASKKEDGEAKLAGEFPGNVLCRILPTMEEVEAAKKADDAEKAAKVEQAAKVAVDAAKTAVDKADQVVVAKVTVEGEVAPDAEHVEQIDLAKQLMAEQTPQVDIK